MTPELEQSFWRTSIRFTVDARAEGLARLFQFIVGRGVESVPPMGHFPFYMSICFFSYGPYVGGGVVISFGTIFMEMVVRVSVSAGGLSSGRPVRAVMGSITSAAGRVFFLDVCSSIIPVRGHF